VGRLVTNNKSVTLVAIGIEKPAALNNLTGDPLTSLKILMAFYPRLRETVSFVHEGKDRLDNINAFLANLGSTTSKLHPF
jgi:hypothetical protein